MTDKAERLCQELAQSAEAFDQLRDQVHQLLEQRDLARAQVAAAVYQEEAAQSHVVRLRAVLRGLKACGLGGCRPCLEMVEDALDSRALSSIFCTKCHRHHPPGMACLEQRT
jgi:phage shock protein A